MHCSVQLSRVSFDGLTRRVEQRRVVSQLANHAIFEFHSLSFDHLHLFLLNTIHIVFTRKINPKCQGKILVTSDKLLARLLIFCMRLQRCSSVTSPTCVNLNTLTDFPLRTHTLIDSSCPTASHSLRMVSIRMLWQ